MATAEELTINTVATAEDLFNEIFGAGVTLVGGTATLQGDAIQSGIYTGAISSLQGISPTDSGVILSTGNVADFTNAAGGATNLTDGTTTDTTGGIDGDADMNSVAGQATFDAAIMEAQFIPTGDTMTIQMVFSSEEYLEFVNGGVNDSLGIFVNGVKVDFVLGSGNISIDEITDTNNSNLYLDNPAGTDEYNTEMDGLTKVLTFKADVNPGVANTIKIGIADGGDAAYDSNVLIMANSMQSVAIANDDVWQIAPSTTAVFDPLANDDDLVGNGLTITQINGVNVLPGQDVTLGTGEVITLNADNTFTVTSDADLTDSSFSYTVDNGSGTTDIGIIQLQTLVAPPADGVVEGTAGNDLIDRCYVGDPEGDRVDNNDAILPGTIDDDDSILGFGGDDTILGGAGSDTIDGGSGNDSIDGNGDGGTGNLLIGGDGDDTIISSGNLGTTTVQGGEGSDYIVSGASAVDIITGGETGTDQDTISFTELDDTVTITYTGDEAGTFADVDGDTGTFSEIEAFNLTTGADVVNGAADSAGINVLAGDGNDTITGGTGNDTIEYGNGSDSILGGDGNDIIDDSTGATTGNNTIDGGAGDDTLLGGGEADTILGGSGNDNIESDGGADSVDGGSGDDSIATFEGNDTVDGGTGADNIQTGNDDDTILLTDGFGNDTITGGEAFETNGDTLDMSGLTTDTTVDLTNANPEAGTVTSGADVATFSEIENITLGGGRDTIVLADGSGTDTVTGFDLTDSDDGTTNDQLDVSGLTSDGGSTPVTTNDVTVTDDGSGNAVLAFPGGESITLLGVPPTAVNSATELAAIGIPLGSDYIVNGTSGDDSIAAGTYTDVDGDAVEANDGNPLSPGAGDADSIEAGLGNDTVDGGVADDTIAGGAGDDSVLCGDGNDLIYGDFSAAGTSYYVAGSNNAPGILYQYDPVTGTSTPLQTIADTYGDIAVADGTIYGVTFSELAPSDAGVYSIDPATGTETLVIDFPDGSLSHPALASDPAGNLYVTTSGGNVTRYEPDGLGGFTSAGSVGTVPSSTFDIVFLDADTAWVTSAGDIYQYDVDGSGNFTNETNLGTVSGDSDVFGLSVGTDGTVYAFESSGEVWSTDPAVTPLVWSPEAPADLEAGDAIWGASDVLDAQGNDTLLGGIGDDSIIGGAGDDSISGQNDNDTILGGDGADTIDGGSGLDSIDAGAGDDSVLGGSGDDTVLGGSGLDTVDGSTGNDLIFGNDGDDLLQGGANNDTLDGGTGSDTLIGGNDNDSLFGGAGADSLIGGTGDDVLSGGSEIDTLEGGDGADLLDGGLGGDGILGGAQDDTISLTDGFGNDTIEGGEVGETAGDTLDLSATTTGVTVDLSNADPEAGTVSDGVDTASFIEIENIVLGSGRDTIVLADGSGADTVQAFDLTDSGDGTTNDQLEV